MIINHEISFPSLKLTLTDMWLLKYTPLGPSFENISDNR